MRLFSRTSQSPPGRPEVRRPDLRSAPDASQRAPAAITDVEQIQLIQRSQDDVEVRYAREQPLSAAEEHAGGERVHQALGYPFRLTFTRQDTIARQPNGKYETFIADIPEPTGSPGTTPL